MRCVLYYSRTGAAAAAAALNYVRKATAQEYAAIWQRLPGYRQWLVYHRTDSETVLAAACGREPQVLRQAISSITAEFGPSLSVQLVFRPESKNLARLLRLRRLCLLPNSVWCLIGHELWYAFLHKEGVGD